MDLTGQKRGVLGVQSDRSSWSGKAAFLDICGELTPKRQGESTHRRALIPLEKH